MRKAPRKRGAVYWLKGEGLKLDIAGNARLTSLLRLRPHRRTCVRLKLVLNQLLVGSNKIMFLATKKNAP